MARIATTSAVIVSAAVVLVAVLVDSSPITNLKPQTNDSKYNAHSQRVLQFKCKIPQPRAVSVRKYFDFKPEERVQPEMTVLHVCDSFVGCCFSSVCGPVKSAIERVTMFFNVTNDLTKTSNLVSFSFTNHTLCKCHKQIPPK